MATKPEDRKYPSSPRLLPGGRGVVCDQCERTWDPAKGETPCCIECADAWVKIETAKRR